jgi:hypothetical protein
MNRPLLNRLLPRKQRDSTSFPRLSLTPATSSTFVRFHTFGQRSIIDPLPKVGVRVRQESGDQPSGRDEIDMKLLNGTCVVLAIASCAASCATTAPASDSVRVTTTLADVDGCNLLGKVIVADGADASKEARNEVVRLGGNVLLRKNDEVWNGNAYQCPAAAH